MIPNQEKDPTNNNGKSYIRKLLDSNYQEVKRYLFWLMMILMTMELKLILIKSIKYRKLQH